MADLIKEKGKELQKLSADAKKLHAEMEADEEKQTTENREKLSKMIEEGEKLREEIKELKKLEELDDFANNPEEKGKFDEGVPAPTESRKSWGQTFTESKTFASAQKHNTPETEAVEVKALHTTTDPTGGVLIEEDRQPGILDRAKLAATTLLDLINVSGTNSNLVSYYTITGFTNNAAEVLEWDPAGPDFGLKPESDLTFGEENSPVQTVAHWLAMSRNMLADVPAIRGLVDGKLLAGLRRRLETQVIGGDGVNPNLRGIVNTPNIQVRYKDSTRGVAGDTKADQLRRALTDIRLAFGKANAIVLNPVEAEALELLKDGNSQYMNIYDPVLQRIWRTAIVENQTLATDKYIAGDFAMGATLFMRENATVRMSENVKDFFIRNAVVILAELRAALAVTEPEMFVDGSFVNQV